MLGDPTTIFFESELRWPNVDDAPIPKEQIIKLYHTLCSTAEYKSYAYENLNLQAEPPTLSTKRPKGVSACAIGKDSLKITESDPTAAAMTIDDFKDQVCNVVKIIDLKMPYFWQRCTIRCTAPPNNQPDSLSLLAGRVANVIDTVRPFQRPPSFFGVRFRFPPLEIEQEDDRQNEDPGKKPRRRRAKQPITFPGYMDLRYETYSADIKLIWISVTGFYHGVIAPGECAQVKENISHTYEFATKYAIDFINQFDKKSEGQDD